MELTRELTQDSVLWLWHILAFSREAELVPILLPFQDPYYFLFVQTLQHVPSLVLFFYLYGIVGFN